MGRNATPMPIITASRYAMGGMALDVCSDETINQQVGADRILTIKDDGYIQELAAETAFLNAPGDSCTGGTYEQRLRHGDRKNIKDYVKPKCIKTLKASHWNRKVYHAWKAGAIQSAIILVYRGGSIGSLGVDLMRDALICLTASGAPSKAVNGSGRFAFEIIDEDGNRIPETDNTQSSAIACLTHDRGVKGRFIEKFDQFGVLYACI